MFTNMNYTALTSSGFGIALDAASVNLAGTPPPPVTEPSTFVLFGSGLLGLAGFVRRPSMGNESRGIGLVQVVWILAGLLVAVAGGFHIFHSSRSSSIRFSTPYQAVLLTNGSVYFGHLQDYGTSHPVLTDVFYVVSQTNGETKQVSNVLVKRGKELYEPDRMYINPNQIVFVETVGTNSAVAQHIAQAPH
jgi:hypothetical protein